MSTQINTYPEWIAKHAVKDLREKILTEDSILDGLFYYEYYDEIRKLIKEEDIHILNSLLDSKSWRIREFAVVISNIIAKSNNTYAQRLKDMFHKEKSCRVNIAIIHVLCSINVVNTDEKKIYLHYLSNDENRKEFKNAQIKYFRLDISNKKEIVNNKIIMRLNDDRFVHSRFLRIYSLANIGGKAYIDIIKKYEEDQDEVTAYSAKLSLDYLEKQ